MTDSPTLFGAPEPEPAPNPIAAYREQHPEAVVWSPDRGWHDEPETVDPDGRLADATNRATDYTLARVDLDTVDLDTLAEQISAAVLAHEDDCGCEFTVTPWPGVAYLHTQETGQ